MSFALVFFAAVACVIVWWLSKQHLMAKPWLEEGVIADAPGPVTAPGLTAKVGLGVFLTVIGSLFALFFFAYSLRMQLADWQALPTPRLLWLNTGMLVLASVAMQWTSVAARRERIEDVKLGLVAGGIASLAFLAGQLLAWQQLMQAGFFLASNPANTFFYLLTAVHGLHLVGGLIALGRTIAKVARGYDANQIRLSIELCTTYWHFLLAVWVVLFAMLLLGTNEPLADLIIRYCAPLLLGTK